MSGRIPICGVCLTFSMDTWRDTCQECGKRPNYDSICRKCSDCCFAGRRDDVLDPPGSGESERRPQPGVDYWPGANT